jgi:hypothetical protein
MGRRGTLQAATHIESLQPGHYYQPSHGSQASFDFFIYDARGINYNQITDSYVRPLKPLGFSFLLQITAQLGLPTPKLRFDSSR